MPKPADPDIQSIVQSFAAQLSDAVRRNTIDDMLRRIRDAGGGEVPIPYSKAGGRMVRVVRMGKAKRKGGRRSADDVAQMGASLLAFVKANPGKRGEEIAKALKTDVGTMRLPMKALIKAKKVKTKGQKRGMTYTAA